MLNIVYLREVGRTRLIGKGNLGGWVIPNHGCRYPIEIDGEEVWCEIEQLGVLKLEDDGRTIISQDIFVRRVEGS